MARTTTYLSLCRKTLRECGIAGQGPASVQSTIHPEESIIGWVRDAWLEIQNLREDWRFMVDGFEFDTVPGLSRYGMDTGGLDGFDILDLETASAYQDSQDDEFWLQEIDYDIWRARYNVGTHEAGTPRQICQRATGDVLLGPTPDAVFHIRGDGYRAPQVLAADGDVVRLEDRYADIIQWRAVMMYAGYDEASAIYFNAKNHYRQIMRQLEARYLPEIENYVSPLA